MTWMRSYVAKNEQRWQKNEERWQWMRSYVAKNEERWKNSEERWQKNEERWQKTSEKQDAVIKLLNTAMTEIRRLKERR